VISICHVGRIPLLATAGKLAGAAGKIAAT
jgi:hypothetical protein